MKIARLVLAGAACSAALAVLPAAASGAATAMPATLDFGSAAVGTTTATKTVTLTSNCSLFIPFPADSCLSGGIDAVDVNAVATGDFVATVGDCPATLQPTNTSSKSCALTVAFKPTVVGARTGTLSTGTVFPGTPGPTVALTGTAAAAPVAPVTPVTPTTPAAKKKCKKKKKKRKGKKAGAAAKKCKKKKRK